MKYTLKDEEIRLLGCLIEKEMATPEYYPLSLNALTNACNQKSNREPVVAYDEETVSQAIEALQEKQLVWQSNLSRVPKYEELLVKENNLIPQEAAILCVLMLRGPQTAGEIRGRSDRLYSFENLEDVNNTLTHLIELDFVARMARQPGRKEVRYCHTMGMEPEESVVQDAQSPDVQPVVKTVVEEDRVAALEEKVASISAELQELKQALTDFKRQFE